MSSRSTSGRDDIPGWRRGPVGLLDVVRGWTQARPTRRPSGSVNVLVVDDNPVNLLTVAAQLESRGLVPVLAADGAEAVALACGLHFDLVLMDLQMPILDGLGATSAIRRFESTSGRRAVPVVAYSSTAADAGTLALHGLNGSLHKPCEDRDLEDCLIQWCTGYRPGPAVRGDARGLRRAHAVSGS